MIIEEDKRKNMKKYKLKKWVKYLLLVILLLLIVVPLFTKVETKEDLIKGSYTCRGSLLQICNK